MAPLCCPFRHVNMRKGQEKIDMLSWISNKS